MYIKKLSSVLLFLSGIALADQFAVIPNSIAKKAVSEFSKNRKYISYCEPCQSSEYDSRCEIIDIKSVSLKQWGNSTDSSEIVINGSDASVDLAYCYIYNNGNWKNLAIYLGLNPVGVSYFINYPSCTLSSKQLEKAEIDQRAENSKIFWKQNQKKITKILFNKAKKYAYYPKSFELIEAYQIGIDSFAITTRGRSGDGKNIIISTSKYYYDGRDYYYIGDSE